MFMVSIGHALSTCLHACGTGASKEDMEGIRYGVAWVRACTLAFAAIFDSKTGTVPSIWSVGTRTYTCMDRTYTGGQ